MEPSVEQTPDLSEAATPGLLRRLAAIFYDSLLVAAILVVASIPPFVLNGSQPITDPWAKAAFQGYLLLVVFVYFAWHWRRGGQTLGMRAWRLRLLRADGRAATWGDCLKRFLAAWLALVPAGLGLVWLLLDTERLAWHDRLSGTRLVLTRKKK